MDECLAQSYEGFFSSCSLDLEELNLSERVYICMLPCCRHALREYNIHKTLDHARIVKLHDVFEIDNNS